MEKEALKKALEKLRQSERHYRVLLDESMAPTFSFYPDGTYRYVNRCFATNLGLLPHEIIGKTIWDIFDKEEADKRFAIVQKVFREGKTEEIEVRVPLPTGVFYFLTTVKAITDDSGAVETVICTSKNITQRKLAEISLKEKHDKLHKALGEIKALSGLIPICASCKKIRDDKGFWNQLETYIQQHSDAQFSHGICPDCMVKLYPVHAKKLGFTDKCHG